MYCPNCGKELKAQEFICENCKSWIFAEEKRTPTPQEAAEISSEKTIDPYGISEYSDGSYRWSYDLNLFKNPVIFITLFKVIMGVTVAVDLAIILAAVFTASDDEYVPDIILSPQWLILPGIMLFLTVLGYLIYALMVGGVFRVDFFIDDDHIAFVQNPVQASKVNKYMRILLIIALIFGKKSSSTLTATGAYMIARYHQMAELSKIRKIKPARWINTIYIKYGFLSTMHVYCSKKEDFEHILQFISDRVSLKKTSMAE